MGNLKKFWEKESFTTVDGREATEGTFTFACGCGAHFEATVNSALGYLFKNPSHCAACSARLAEEMRVEQEKNLRSEREEKWNAVCPPLYRDTDLSHPGLSRAAIDCVSKWDMQNGIGLLGESGKGKTRLLFLALRKVFDAGKYVRVISHNKFSKLVMDAFMGDSRSENSKQLDALRRTHFLMIDDLGKAPSTERADAEMEELVEYRVSNSLPILWSANAGGGWLENRFGPDRGPALVRRLAQFCECVTV